MWKEIKKIMKREIFALNSPAQMIARGLPINRDFRYRFSLRIWLKFRAILGWSKFVSAYVERDKKILKNLIFAFAPLRIWSIFRRSRFLVRE